MKNFVLSVIIMAVSAAVLQMFLPWWVIAITGFLIGAAVKQGSLAAFAAGFLSVFLLWIAYAYLLTSANNNLLAHKVAQLLPLKGNVPALLLITGVIGGLVSGFAALTGSLAAKLGNN